MTDQSEYLLDWWRSHNGLFTDLDKVVPHVVVHCAPVPTDPMPIPMLVGACSFQAELLGQPNPELLTTAIGRMPKRYKQSVLRQHSEVIAKWAPDFADTSLVLPAELGGGDLFYHRLILPVRTTVGDNLLLTHTAATTLH